MSQVNSKELEMAIAMEQLNSQIGYFRNEALSWRNRAIKMRNEREIWQLVILSLLLAGNRSGIDIDVHTFERLKKFSGMKLQKKWLPNGSLTIRLVEIHDEKKAS